MSSKRYKGLPDTGIGKLLSWVKSDDEAFPDGGYYEISEAAKTDQSKIRIPRELIEFLRTRLAKAGHLSYSVAGSIPNNKVVLFYLFSALGNDDWGDEFKKAYDNERDKPFHQVMEAQSARKVHDRYYDKSDRELLMAVMDAVNNIQTGAHHENALHRREYDRLRGLSYGLLRASSWQIAVQAGIPPYFAKFYSDMGDKYPQSFVKNFNTAKLGEMSDALAGMGATDVDRLNQNMRH